MFESTDLTIEEWRDIPGYEGYQASNLGAVRSVERTVNVGGRLLSYKGQILKQEEYGNGQSVLLYKNGKRQHRFVHVLVALAFIGPCPDGQIVRHGVKG